jgi:hypothetical protein
MSFELTESELLQAIADAAVNNTPDDPDGAFRVAEVAAAMGWSTKRVIMSLHRMQAAGKLQRCKVWRLDLAGRRMPVPAYRILP